MPGYSLYMRSSLTTPEGGICDADHDLAGQGSREIIRVTIDHCEARGMRHNNSDDGMEMKTTNLAKLTVKQETLC